MDIGIPFIVSPLSVRRHGVCRFVLGNWDDEEKVNDESEIVAYLAAFERVAVRQAKAVCLGIIVIDFSNNINKISYLSWD